MYWSRSFDLSTSYFVYTVTLVYKDHHRDPQNMVVIHRWSLYAGTVTWEVYPPGLAVKCGLYKQVVVIYRWSLQRVRLHSRQDVGAPAGGAPTSRLTLGMFTIFPAYSTLYPGSQVTVTVDCIAETQGHSAEVSLSSHHCKYKPTSQYWYSETCLERLLPWETTGLERPNTPGRSSCIHCNRTYHQRPPVLRDHNFMANGWFHCIRNF